MSRVYAIASAKGGVGKTTTTANLGTVLSMAGHDVVVVDGDLGMPNLAGALGVDPDGETLHDVLTGETPVESATYEGPEGLSVVPGSTALEAFANANAKELHPVIEALKETHDIVLVDTGAGLSDDTFVPLKLADEVLLVSTTEREALGDTEKTRQLGERIGADVVGVVLTRVNQSNPNADEVASLLDAGVIAVVPEDAAIREALNTQIPVVARSPQSIAAAGYRALAEALTGEPVPMPDADEADDTHADEADDTHADADEATPEPPQSPETAEPDDIDADNDDDEVTVVQTDTESSPEPESDASPEPESESVGGPEPESVSSSDQRTDTEPDSDEQASEPADEQPSESDPVTAESAEAGHSDTSDDTEPEPTAESVSADEDESDVEGGEDPNVESTLEAKAEAALDAETDATPDEETDSLDGAIPFGGDRDDSSETADADSLTSGDDDPVTADLDSAESMGPDPLAGDAVDETSDGDTTVSVEAADADSESDDAASEAEAESAVTSESDADDGADSSAGGATAVIEEAPDSGGEPLVAEAEPDAVAPDAEADGDEEEGVYTTSLVEEVESLEDDDEDDQKKGFLSRFLG